MIHINLTRDLQATYPMQEGEPYRGVDCNMMGPVWAQ